jgi:hypothetical protein
MLVYASAGVGDVEYLCIWQFVGESEKAYKLLVYSLILFFHDGEGCLIHLARHHGL